jgi:hypothetical protein
LPVLVTSGGPVIGSPSFAIGVMSARPNALAIAFASLGYADAVVNGPCHAYVDASQLVLPDASTPTSFMTGPGGSGALTTGVPNDPSLMGLSAYVQVLVADPAGAAFPQFGGAALTRALRLVFGTP